MVRAFAFTLLTTTALSAQAQGLYLGLEGGLVVGSRGLQIPIVYAVELPLTDELGLAFEGGSPILGPGGFVVLEGRVLAGDRILAAGIGAGAVLNPGRRPETVATPGFYIRVGPYRDLGLFAQLLTAFEAEAPPIYTFRLGVAFRSGVRP